MKCTVCGRPLRDPVSIALGAGPICRGKKSKSSPKKQRSFGGLLRHSTTTKKEVEVVELKDIVDTDFEFASLAEILNDELGYIARVQIDCDDSSQMLDIAITPRQARSLMINGAKQGAIVSTHGEQSKTITVFSQNALGLGLLAGAGQ